MAAATLTTSASLLTLLDEPDKSMQVYALENVNNIVDQYWAEIADSVSKIEQLYEDEKFPSRELAALVASKIYFNLGEFGPAMDYALSAKELFDVTDKSEYVETIVSKCIDHYISVSQLLNDTPPSKRDALPDHVKHINPDLVNIVERMFQRCIDEKEYEQAIGVALESRRLDTIEHIIKIGFAWDPSKKLPTDPKVYMKIHPDRETKTSEELAKKAESTGSSLIQYTLNCSLSLVASRGFREKVLRMLCPLIFSLKLPDYFTAAKVFISLEDFDLASHMLQELLSEGSELSLLVVYQVAFDFESSGTQNFLLNVSEAIDETKSPAHAQVRTILSGVPTLDIETTFLSEHNHTDLKILEKAKDTLDARNSLFHAAVTFENAFLHAGTTSDTFYRTNLDFLSKASNWSKFSATAALGVIHQGNLSQGMNILKPYLPKRRNEAADASSASRLNSGMVFSEGGSLFGLGLIFAAHGQEVLPFLLEFLSEEALPPTDTDADRDSNDSAALQHGAALGVGLAGMATNNAQLHDGLRTVLYNDNAVIGEAAGIAMGLVMLGSANQEAINEMMTYAGDTQHEKIIRGLAVGMALIMYGREETADPVIEKLCDSGDPVLRYGGIFMIALAYCGTGNNEAIKKLLHVAVSDASDEVRRAAVMSLGFILFRTPQAVPRMVELLSESYNPHVRFGAAMALGISCAGTGLTEAIDLLEPMLRDPADIVRQGVLIALSMILMQQNAKMSPKVTNIRKAFEKVLADKHEDAIAKFGAALGQGIIDAGGRNVTISLENKQTGALNMKAIVGMAVFTQFWYWFPLTHFLSLSFTPTAVIGVRQDLKIPKFSFYSTVNPSFFDYPPMIEESANKAPEKVETAVLSTTARALARAKKTEKEKAEKEQGDDVEMKDEQSETKKDEELPDAPTGDSEEVSPPKEDQQQQQQAQQTQERQTGGIWKIENMTRVVPREMKYVHLTLESDDFVATAAANEDHKSSERFLPVKKFRHNGTIFVLRDLYPNQDTEFIETFKEKNATPSQQQQQQIDESSSNSYGEAPVPEPFEYDTDTEL